MVLNLVGGTESHKFHKCIHRAFRSRKKNLFFHLHFPRVSMRSLRWVGDNWTSPFLSRIFPVVAHFYVFVPSVYPNFHLRDSNRWRSASSGLFLDTVHGRYQNIYGWGNIWENINNFSKMRKKSSGKERWNNTISQFLQFQGPSKREVASGLLN